MTDTKIRTSSDIIQDRSAIYQQARKNRLSRPDLSFQAGGEESVAGYLDLMQRTEYLFDFSVPCMSEISSFLETSATGLSDIMT